ncbi:hypothetical protein CMI37_37080 [Candidatus Pacearchaeota archaeon]|nr:hypothetical protein [Candidatus Pacearchaeota archaeon]|tara:strand:- start:171 stop:479 length:309 start_codon:yes stop_codon:yes gene_type:complete
METDDALKAILTMDNEELSQARKYIKTRYTQLEDVKLLEFSISDIVHIIDRPGARNPINPEDKWIVNRINQKTISVKPVKGHGAGWKVPPGMLKKFKETVKS